MILSLTTRKPQQEDGQNQLLARLIGVPERGVILASAARTSTTTSTPVDWAKARGVLLYINITAASGTGGLSVFPEYQDPVSLAWNRLWNYPATAARLTSNGLYLAVVGDGYGVQSGGVIQGGFVSAPLGSVMRITVNHGDASSYTYSVGYELIP